jgi:ferredoxin
LRPYVDGGKKMVEQTRTGTMKVKVDQEKCQGHNRCFVVASELFELDDYGYAHEVGDGTVPAELEEKARLAVVNCPENAINIEEE